ncbi:MAG: hypothetical protein IRZ16_13985 [Myxococcaceae bacterium]|nr:hypothetical protein [Myxococcaceae bacterium]
MRSSPFLLLWAIASSAPLSGCASMWLLSEATDMNWSTSSYDEVTPGAETERGVQVRTRYVPPPPVEPAMVPSEAGGTDVSSPAAPLPYTAGATLPGDSSTSSRAGSESVPQTSSVAGATPSPSLPAVTSPDHPHSSAPARSEADISVAVPAPPPGQVFVPAPAPPEGALALDCQLMQRPTTEHVRSHLFRYEGSWKPLTAFSFLGEAAMATILLLNSRDARTSDDSRALLIGFGAGFGLDAIGTAILFFHPKEERVVEYDRPGNWSPIGGCPEDLRLRVGHTEVPVAPDGSIPPPIDREALLSISRPGGTFDLRFGRDSRTIELSAGERCEWAKTRGLDPSAFCAPPGALDAPLLEWRAPTTEPFFLEERGSDRASASVTPP